jgi:hypothetical protein
MQGRGVTNFSGDKPSYALSTQTTEFDDQLIQRGIVSKEQVMMAKGASPEEAVRLAQGGKSKEDPEEETRMQQQTSSLQEDDDGDDDDSDLDMLEDDDDDFLAKYRQERLAQLKQEHSISSSNSSTVEHITRDQWKEKVNDASSDRWVLVTLTDAPNHQNILQELHQLGRQYTEFPLLTIDAAQAIPNWPSERVPSIFCYRGGIKQHEWIAPENGKFPTRDQLEKLLQQWSIII